jgi:hypothetical protein
MSDESDIERLVKKIDDYSDGVSDVLEHPIRSVRYWNRNDAFMKKIGKLNGYTMYLVAAFSVAAIAYELI